MSITVLCPHCGKKLKAEPRIAGQEVGCPGCKGRLVIPIAAPAQPPPLPVAKQEADPLGFLESPTPTPKPGTAICSAATTSTSPKRITKRFKWSNLPIWLRTTIAVVILLILVAMSHSNQRQGSPQGGGGNTESSSHGNVGNTSADAGDMTENEFQQAVVGNTIGQIEEWFGPPTIDCISSDHSLADGGELSLDQCAFFDGAYNVRIRIIDPGTGHIAWKELIHFEFGIATRVAFY